MELQLKQPFPSRHAATALREQLIEYLMRQRPNIGDRFLTDADLMRISALSRSTVRRALDELHREGWIERRIGQGTFVGARVGMPGPAAQRSGLPETKRAGLIRLAVLVFGIGDLAHDWYTPLVLEGIDESAEGLGVSVELIGNRERDVEAISRRVVQNPPDVLVCLASEPRQAFVIRDAQRLGVRGRREKPIVEPGAVADSVAAWIEGEAGHDDDVDRRELGQGRVGERLGEAMAALREGVVERARRRHGHPAKAHLGGRRRGIPACRRPGRSHLADKPPFTSSVLHPLT